MGIVAPRGDELVSKLATRIPTRERGAAALS